MNKLKVLISRSFWDDALVRGIRTFFQAALAYIGVNVVAITEIDYVGAASIGGGAAVISIAQSVVRIATAKIDEDPFDVEGAIEDVAAEDDAILDEVVNDAIEDGRK